MAQNSFLSPCFAVSAVSASDQVFSRSAIFTLQTLFNWVKTASAIGLVEPDLTQFKNRHSTPREIIRKNFQKNLRGHPRLLTYLKDTVSNVKNFL